jgi:hypothetical protein
MCTKALITKLLTWTVIIGIKQVSFEKNDKRKKNKMNEHEQPQKESFKILFILAGFYSLAALAIILVLLIYN